MSCVTQSNNRQSLQALLPGIPLQIVPYPNIQSLLFMCGLLRSWTRIQISLHLCSDDKLPQRHTGSPAIDCGPLLWFCHTLRVICTYPPTFHCNFCIRHPHPASRSLWPPSSVERKRELFSIIKLTLWVKVYDRDIVSGPKSKWRPIRMRWIRAAPGSGCQGEQWMLYVRRRRGVDDACVHCKINYIACVSILGPTVHSHILQRSHPLAYASFVPPYVPNFIVCEIAQHATFYIIDAVLH